MFILAIIMILEHTALLIIGVYLLHTLRHLDIGRKPSAPASHTAASSPSIPTLNQYYKMWQDSRVGTIAPSTAYNNDKRFVNISQQLGDVPLNEITADHIVSFQKYLLSKTIIRGDIDTGKHYSTRTIKEEISLLSSILHSAVQAEYIVKNPCKHVKPVRNANATSIRDTSHRALSDEELKVFLDEAKSSWYYPLFVFMLQTGCRAGEAAALTWEDIDFKKRLIHIHQTIEQTSANDWIISKCPKTSSGKRKIPFNDEVEKILCFQREKISHLKKQTSSPTALDSNMIFLDTRGNYVTRNNINAAIKSVIKRLHKNDVHTYHTFSSHAFRHTFATKCVEQGIKPEILKEILGHSDIKMTMETYYHLSTERMSSVMNGIFI